MPKKNTTSIIVVVVVIIFCCCCAGLIASLGGGYFYTTSAISSGYNVDGEWEILRMRTGKDGEWLMWKDLPEVTQNVLYEFQTIEDQIQIKTLRINKDKKEKIGNTWLFKIDSKSVSGINAKGMGQFEALHLEYPYDNKQLVKLYIEGVSPTQPPKPKPKDTSEGKANANGSEETEVKSKSAEPEEPEPEPIFELVTVILVPKATDM
jgi:hypothetical protein